MINPWFKFYAGEYLSDLKILQMTAQERSCWITLLCLANQGEGTVKFLSEEQLLVMSGIKGEYPGVLKKFEDLGMITLGNGNVTVTNWEKRQYSEGYSRVKRFRQNHPETKLKSKIENSKYRARKYGAEGSFTVEEWEELKEKYGLRCANCKNEETIEIPLTVDHIVPLSKGGSNYISNIQPLCSFCNTSKHDNLKDNDREEKNREEKNREEKKDAHGEFKKVFLSPEEFSKLIEKLGEKNTNILITELDGYIQSLGKKGETKYRDHYATLLNWARRKITEHQSKLQTKTRIIA